MSLVVPYTPEKQPGNVNYARAVPMIGGIILVRV